MTTTTVYALHRGDGVPFNVGCTTRPAQRQREHQESRADDSIQLRALATYSTIAAGYRAEICAWESFVALGHPIENDRPTGKPSFTDDQRRVAARKMNASITHEQRVVRNASMTHEQRSIAARDGNASLTPEHRSAIARKRSADVRPVTCPDCGMTSNPGAIASHRRFKHAA
ncbi:MAG: hypothetical protein M3Q30_19760 [Actinomycetota bacterium]|nr:hypothetical protein [Actinomycetota bacterium]